MNEITTNDLRFSTCVFAC